jgi:hypothetical protein
MSIYSPPQGWLQAPKGPERLWIGLALTWCIVMSLAMPYWHFYGKQNSSGESYRVSTTDFGARVRQFAEANKVGEEAGVPIAEIPPGGDGYLLARMWSFYPEEGADLPPAHLVDGSSTRFLAPTAEHELPGAAGLRPRADHHTDQHRRLSHRL